MADCTRCRQPATLGTALTATFNACKLVIPLCDGCFIIFGQEVMRQNDPPVLSLYLHSNTFGTLKARTKPLPSQDPHSDG